MSAANPLQFIDAGIVLYAHDASAGEKHARARELIKQLWLSETGCLSVQVLQEFYVNVTQKVPQPITREAAAQIVADLSAWKIHSPTAEDVLEATRLQQRYALSFWDAMILASALQMNCHVLWSEDLQAGSSYGPLTVVNPFNETSQKA